MEYLILALLVIVAVGMIRNKTFQITLNINHKYDVPPPAQIKDPEFENESRSADDGTRTLTQSLQELNKIMTGGDFDE